MCRLQHKLIGFYNRDEKCLQRGTDWVFNYSSLRFVFKGLMHIVDLLVLTLVTVSISNKSVKQQTLRETRMNDEFMQSSKDVVHKVGVSFMLTGDKMCAGGI